MNKRLTILSLTIFIIFCMHVMLLAQTYQWVKGGGSDLSITTLSQSEQINQMCTDANGNVYALGVMGNGTMVADTFHRTMAYTAPRNVFLASYNCNGQMRWAKLIGSGNDTYASGICTDGLGHVYVSGNFIHNGGAHTLYVGYDTTLPLATYICNGLIQFDTSGEFNWIHLLGDNTPFSYSALGSGPVLVDAANNAHFICNTLYGAHITPSLISHCGAYDVTFDASGTILGASKLLQDTTLFVYGAVLDKVSGKLYAYGHRPPVFVSMGIHPYITAFDPSRNLIWTDTLSDGTTVDNTAFSSICSDNNGHLYLTAGAYGTMIYRHDTVRSVLTPSSPIASVLKLDTAGNLKWNRAFSSNISLNFFMAITLMPGNKVAAAGFMLGQVVSGTDTMYNYGGEHQNAYYTILDTAGYIQRLDQLHGSGSYDEAYALTADKKGSLYIGGAIDGNVWGGSIAPYNSVGGNTDFFIVKYGVDCDCTYMPTANYTVTGSTTKTFTYTGTTTAIDSVRWEFGDGGTSTLTNPTHTYTTGDTFTACVTVFTHCGSDMRCHDLIVPCVTAPTASYTTSGTGLSKTFTYSGTGLGTGSLSWNFGDGTPVVSGTSVTHTFSAAGTYNVCITATNSCGSNVSCTTITVACSTLPISNFTFAGLGATRNFTYTGTTAGLDSVTWTFGDGGTATGLTPTHTYATTGLKTVCATVHTNCGINTQCLAITILCTTAPVAAFTSTGTGASRSFNYTGTTAAIDSARWTFGDGSTATGLTPGHAYAATGTYHVCVTVYTPCGSNMICHDVTITCIATITASFTDTGNAAHGFTYTGTTAGLDSVVWNYGDAHHDTGKVKTHTYAVADTYYVCVTVYTDCGSDTGCRDVIVTHPTDVEALAVSEIKVFPNPATNELSVTGIQELTSYRILTITGVNLQIGTLQKGSNIVTIPLISAGTYLLEMTGPTGEKNTIRFIKG